MAYAVSPTLPRFDVYIAPVADPDDKVFLMSAPLYSLGLVLDTHPAALSRIETEMGRLAYDEVTLHQNGRGKFAHSILYVRKAGF